MSDNFQNAASILSSVGISMEALQSNYDISDEEYQEAKREMQVRRHNPNSFLGEFDDVFRLSDSFASLGLSQIEFF